MRLDHPPIQNEPLEERLLKAAEVQTKYIIVDMYAKAIQGMAAEDSVKWAHDELVKVYNG